MNQVLAFLGCTLGLCFNALGQGGLLTLKDAQVLVEKTPAFMRAQQSGYCPQSGGDAWVSGTTAYFIIRGECKATMLVENVEVDLSTGLITDSITSKSIETPLLGELRTALLKARNAVLITRSEALCLLDTVVPVKSVGQCDRVDIIGEDDRYFTVAVSYGCNSKASGKETLRIDRTSAAVLRNDLTLTSLSAAAENLIRELVSKHATPMLTATEAERLTRALWAKDSTAEQQCFKVDRESGHNATDLWFQVRTSCGRGGSRVARIAVDLLTGKSHDIETGKPLDSPQAAELRGYLLTQAQRRVASAAETILKKCGGYR